ncbi:AAA family ATPase [Bdellovibrio sp. HCB337]|uniref:AAA family ATPase n=1 Tax=Bdellovibrio sp. HCB337 TaxID=3394358 RepID=UPI0039A6D268
MKYPKLNAFSKVVVIGTSGAGKTTFAKAVSQKFDIPDVELDALYWEPNWTAATPESFQNRVQAATLNKGWVVHGNYRVVRDFLWHKADLIIWLDYPRHIILWRILKRSIYRAFTQKPMWNGNYESIRLTFFSKDSIILWSITSYAHNKKDYGNMMASSPFAPKMLRIKHPRDAAKLLE